MTTTLVDLPYALLGDILLQCDTCADIGHALCASKHFGRAMDRAVVAGIRAKRIHEKTQAERAEQRARWTAWKHRKEIYMMACLEELLGDHTPAFLFSDPDGIALAYQDQTRAELTFDICDPEPPLPS